MSTLRTATRLAAVVAAITLAQGCATTSHPASATPAANAQTTPEKTASEAYPTTPPPPGPATDVAFPPIHHDKLANGLQIVVVEDDADLGVGAMTFPAAGSAADLALLLADHHGASLIVTAGHTASIEEFFDRSRQRSNPSTFLTRLKVGEKLVDAKAVSTLYRSRISGGAVAMLVLAMLIAVIVALWVSRTDTVVFTWLADYWNRFALWIQHLVS